MKVYVAGPMRGIPEFNFPAFHAAAARLRALGHEVFNPAENDEEMKAKGLEINIRNCLGIDLAWICANAEAVALLPGWQNSKGACAEKATAEALGIKVLYIYDFGIVDDEDLITAWRSGTTFAPAIPNFDTVR